MKVRILLPTSFPREWERARGISTSSVPDAAGVPAVRMLSPFSFLLPPPLNCINTKGPAPHRHFCGKQLQGAVRRRPFIWCYPRRSR